MILPFLPDIKFSNDKRYLYNRIIKKQYVNRPEERVRLGVLEQLLAVSKWSTQRIGFEIKTKHESSNLLRTDLIAYDKKFEPEILIECKAPEVKITEDVVKQAFRYNQQLNAPWVICTNGLQCLAFKKNVGTAVFEQTAEHPLSLTSYIPQQPPSSFWQAKGFLGKQAVIKPTEDWLNQHLCGLKKVHWLDLPPVSAAINYSHFYAQWPTDPKLWFSFVALADQSSWVVFVDASKSPAVITALCLSIKAERAQHNLGRQFHFRNGKWATPESPASEMEHFTTLEALKDFLL